MIGLVITGHINFATGYKSAVSAIAGESSQVEYVDFIESLSTKELRVRIAEAADRVDSGEGVLFLTDISGGSPFQCAASIASEMSNADVISGVNLVIVAEACLEREEMALGDLVPHLINAGVSNIKSLQQSLHTDKSNTSIDSGI